MIERLFQLSADTGTKSDPPSFTFTRESYDKAARHEAIVLLLNGRVPDYNVRLNYRVEMPAKEIAALWRKHSRRLERAGIVARVAIEITKNKRRTRPVNRVHYHLAVQDTRTPAELRAIVRNVCRCEMPPKSFRVTCKAITDWKNRDVWYFVKYRVWSNYLFKPNLPLQKFYFIGDWWTHKDGTLGTRESIEEQIQLYAVEQRLKQSAKLIPVKHRPPEKPQPTDDRAMKGLLCNETDETLYDWFSTLRGKVTLFSSDIPDWLTNTLQSQWKKRRDLLEALYDRVSDSENRDIIFALQIFHSDIIYDLTSQKLVAVKGSKLFAGLSLQ